MRPLVWMLAASGLCLWPASVRAGTFADPDLGVSGVLDGRSAGADGGAVGDADRIYCAATGAWRAEHVPGLVRRSDVPVLEILERPGKGDDPPCGTWLLAVSEPVPASGTRPVRARLPDGGLSSVRSMLGVDDVQAGIVMPEPMTMIAGFLGLAGIAGYVRKRLTK